MAHVERCVDMVTLLTVLAALAAAVAAGFGAYFGWIATRLGLIAREEDDIDQLSTRLRRLEEASRSYAIWGEIGVDHPKVQEGIERDLADFRAALADLTGHWAWGTSPEERAITLIRLEEGEPWESYKLVHEARRRLHARRRELRDKTRAAGTPWPRGLWRALRRLLRT